MDLSSSLVKEFAKMANQKDTNTTPQYLKGTAKTIGDKKYVQIDGSSSYTPIAETVDIQDGDRVLVTIDNHTATVIGNLTYPPSARKEEEAVNKAEDAQNSANSALENSNLAMENAQSAMENASTASEAASIANVQAEEAKTAAGQAMTAATTASNKADQANAAATEAKESAQSAQTSATQAQESVSLANTEISKLNTAVDGVKTDIQAAQTELGNLASETAIIKNTMETSYAKKTEVSDVEASLKSEISQSVVQLQATVEQNYAAKTYVDDALVSVEGKLQTQITQNAESISSQATKIEKVEADTAAAQLEVNAAKQAASAAQTAASAAQSAANLASTQAQEAQTAAIEANNKAKAAQSAADAATATANKADLAVQAAQTDLNEAKQNLASVTSRVDATEEEIAAAESAVAQAQQDVITAMENAATANAQANAATEAANQAKIDAETASGVATDAQNKATNAQLAADKAQADAQKAQEEVAALTSRVTTAETNITQNAEQIALTASKTEEIGELLVNNYYNKTQTDAAIDLKADEITLEVTKTVETTVQEKVDEIEIGARNLFLNSEFNENFDNWNYPEVTPEIEITNLEGKNCAHIPSTTSSHVYQNIIARVNTEDILKEYTFSGDFRLDNYIAGTTPKIAMYIEGVTGETQTTITLTDIYGSSDIIQYAGQGWVRATWVVKLSEVPDSLNDNNYLRAGIVALNFTGDLYFKRLKIEKGNKVTDWSPSPEDSEDYAINAIQENNTTIVEQYTSLIQQASDQLNLLVQELQHTQESQTQSITSLTNQLQITSEMAQFVKTTVETLEDVVSGKVDTETIREWARFDGASLELGASNSPFKAVLSNTELGFWQGSNKVAWISNNELYILTAIITKSIGCGQFTFVDEGDLGLSLI